MLIRPHSKVTHGDYEINVSTEPKVCKRIFWKYFIKKRSCN